MTFRTIFFALALCLPAMLAPASAAVLAEPLRFFEGRTETVGIIKLAMKKPFKSVSHGRGVIKADGSLDLIQRVEDEGELPRERRWKIRKVGPAKWTGTMSEASGPVTIEEIDGNYRFRFRMAGGVSVEQWLIPDASGRSGKSKITIKKYGIKVGSSDGTVRKLD